MLHWIELSNVFDLGIGDAWIGELGGLLDSDDEESVSVRSCVRLGLG